jgi:hypothetical protein
MPPVTGGETAVDQAAKDQEQEMQLANGYYLIHGLEKSKLMQEDHMM